MKHEESDTSSYNVHLRYGIWRRSRTLFSLDTFVMSYNYDRNLICQFISLTGYTLAPEKQMNKKDFLKHSGRKSNEHTFRLKKGNINRMLSERWPITKWIKHIAAQVASVHSSGWNVKINSQIKKIFFQPIKNLAPKTFWSRFFPQQSYKKRYPET